MQQTKKSVQRTIWFAVVLVSAWLLCFSFPSEVEGQLAARPLLEVHTDCPDKATIRRQMAASNLPDRAATVVITIRRGDAVHVVYSVEGLSPIERAIRSEDCIAVADAITEILVALLEVEFAEVEPPPDHPETVEVEARTESSTPNDEASMSVRDERGQLVGLVGVGLEGHLAFDPEDAGARLSISGGFRWRDLGVELLLRASALLPSEQESAGQRVRFLAGQANLMGQLRRGDPIGVAASAGFGVRATHASALDLADTPSAISFSFWLLAATGVFVNVSRSLRLELELLGGLAVRNQRFEIDPVGQVAGIPTVELGLRLGAVLLP